MTASDEGFGAAIGELRDRGSHGGGQCGEQDAHEQALLLVHDSVPQLARAIGWTLASDELALALDCVRHHLPAFPTLRRMVSPT